MARVTGFPAELVAFHIVLPLVLEYQDIRVQLTGLVTFGLHLIAGADRSCRQHCNALF